MHFELVIVKIFGDKCNEAYKIDRKSIDRMRMIENIFDQVRSFENKVYF